MTVRRSRASGHITLADVARSAGVSPITASRALRGERGVAQELTARVQEAVRKLGYVPDPAARALASQHGSHVGVLVPALSNALFVDVLEALLRTLRPAGYQTLIGITHYDKSEEEQLLREQLLHRPAGLIVTGRDHTGATRELMARSAVPCVHLMELVDEDGVHSVGFSQRDAAAAMTRHLIERGRRRIAFAAAQLDPRTMRRLDGWRGEMRSHGLHEARLEWLNPALSSMALGAQMFEQILAQRPAVDAVFFCNDDLAQGALLSAARLGVRVPQDVAVAGFNDLPGSDQMAPPLTTVRTRLDEIGTAAGSMLLSLMQHRPVERKRIDVGFELVVRGST